MRKRRFSLWRILLSCFMVIVLVMIAGSIISQRAYQTFYRDFAKEYELLLQIIELKNDAAKMYNSTTTLSGTITIHIEPNLKVYEEAYQDATGRIAALKDRFDGELLYVLIDVGNMFLTFDENYRQYLSRREENYSIYLTTDVQYLWRLEGYIKDELTRAGEMLTVEAKQSYDEFASDLNQIQARFYLVMVLCAVLSLLVSLWVTRRVSGSIRILVRRMARFAKDGTDEPKEYISGSISVLELDGLENSYDTMVKEIDQKRMVDQELGRQQLENIETRSLLKSAELDMLRMQIDPHFLFNTLNSIGALAELENAPHAGDMVARLAKMLRYSMNAKSQVVMLKEELMIAEDYVTIQRTRFGDKLCYESHVSPDALTWLIPSMIIQPLIENALQHGFPKLKAGDSIVLNATLEKDELIISVRDNGVGMNPECLQEICFPDGQNAKSIHGIGLCNVLQRMRLMYGEGHVMLESILGVGTCITMHIPGKTDRMNDPDDP